VTAATYCNGSKYAAYPPVYIMACIIFVMINHCAMVVTVDECKGACAAPFSTLALSSHSPMGMQKGLLE
jgi:drug/metabolite transporter superfamily protein YnfA